jgi:hypothetical protein
MKEFFERRTLRMSLTISWFSQAILSFKWLRFCIYSAVSLDTGLCFWHLHSLLGAQFQKFS